MASRPELVQMCMELGLDWEGKPIDDMKEMIREEADKRFNKRYHVSADDLSYALKKFLTEEYDYVILNKKGEIQ